MFKEGKLKNVNLFLKSYWRASYTPHGRTKMYLYKTTPEWKKICFFLQYSFLVSLTFLRKKKGRSKSHHFFPFSFQISRLPFDIQRCVDIYIGVSVAFSDCIRKHRRQTQHANMDWKQTNVRTPPPTSKKRSSHTTYAELMVSDSSTPYIRGTTIESITKTHNRQRTRKKKQK